MNRCFMLLYVNGYWTDFVQAYAFRCLGLDLSDNDRASWTEARDALTVLALNAVASDFDGGLAFQFQLKAHHGKR